MGGRGRGLPSPSQTRLVTIVAHVDHGKTTLADNLIESNGIISERLAGTLRYLDSSEEEQRRGITMRSSAIALQHTYKPPPAARAAARKQQQQQQRRTDADSGGGGSVDGDGDGDDNERMVIHLIDSPGHVDFATEVSSALVACDSALLLVDVVEGMCARTHAVLREAHANHLVPILVLNKLDRLCTELHLTVGEAYVRIRGLLESVNAASAAMILNARAARDEEDEGKGGKERNGGEEKKEDYTGRSVNNSGKKNGNNRSRGNTCENAGGENKDDEESTLWNFDPARGNVVFTSALHGWGFTLPSLSRSVFKSKLVPNLKPPQLRTVLFGDYRYNDVTGKIVKWKQGSEGCEDVGQSTLFAEFALRPIWNVYEGVAEAAASCGISSISYGGGGTGGAGTAAAGTSSSSGGGGSTSVKIKSSSPGMDRVLEALQTFHTCPPPTTNSNGAGGGAVENKEIAHQGELYVSPIPTEEDLQSILNKHSGSSSEEGVLRAILRRYRPLSSSVLDSVCEIGPSPREATSRIRTGPLALQIPPTPPGPSAAFDRIQSAVKGCEVEVSGGRVVPTVAHVCKFMAVKRRDINDPDMGRSNFSSSMESGDGGDGSTEKEGGGDVLMALVRVLSGSLTSANGAEYNVYGPKYTGVIEGTTEVDVPPRRKVRAYLLMGAELVRVKSIPAGHIGAVSNLDDLELKTMTLCDVDGGMPLVGLSSGKKPLVKVNVEAQKASETDILERGLLKLSLADGAVEVTATARGERLLACQGELHLEQCILDLKRVYCERPIELRISDPIVDFAESTDWFEQEDEYQAFFDASRKAPPLRQTTIPPYCDEEGLSNAKRGRCRSILSGRGSALSLRVAPLATSVYNSLKGNKVVEGCEEDICFFAKAIGVLASENDGDRSATDVLSLLMERVCALDGYGNCLMEAPAMYHGSSIKAVFSENGEVYMPPQIVEEKAGWRDAKDDGGDYDGQDDGVSATARGLKEYEAVQQCIEHASESARQNSGEEEGGNSSDTCDNVGSPEDAAARSLWKKEMRGSAVAGFQLSMRAGPWCKEPLRGVAVVLEGLEVAMTPGGKVDGLFPFLPSKPIGGGMVVSAVRQGTRCALLTRPARIVEGHLRLTLHSSLAALGPLYAVLSKRRGKVVSDEMVDGTDLILITATLPQGESFGLFQELLSKTSGEITAPELVFSHFEMLDEDPFWIPMSDEEREDYGEILLNGDRSTGVANNAISILRAVRKRKGLLTDSAKIVADAEKQRTLARKK